MPPRHRSCRWRWCRRSPTGRPGNAHQPDDGCHDPSEYPLKGHAFASSVVYGIIKNHHGTVFCSSGPDVKVIIASGYHDAHLKEDIVTSGAKAYITKPYKLSEISEIVRQVLDKEQ